MSRIVFKSSDSLKYYPNNVANDFTVKIPNLSSMGSNLKVAIVEIIFPLGFKNVRDGHNSIKISNEKYRDDPWIFTIEPNFYTPSSLIDEINKKTKALKFISFATAGLGNTTIQDKTQLDDIHYCIMNKVKGIHIKFDVDIGKILGFTSNEWLTGAEESTQNRMGAYKNMSLLNVYCDIVEESLIGEDHYQLLRLVNWNAAKKDDTSPSITYSYPYFIPVKHTNVNSITIKITDSLNIPVEFIGDEPIVVILEFRKE